jgi:hypothetical protein
MNFDGQCAHCIKFRCSSVGWPPHPPCHGGHSRSSSTLSPDSNRVAHWHCELMIGTVPANGQQLTRGSELQLEHIELELEPLRKGPGTQMRPVGCGGLFASGHWQTRRCH